MYNRCMLIKNKELNNMKELTREQKIDFIIKNQGQEFISQAGKNISDTELEALFIKEVLESHPLLSEYKLSKGK